MPYVFQRELKSKEGIPKADSENFIPQTRKENIPSQTRHCGPNLTSPPFFCTFFFGGFTFDSWAFIPIRYEPFAGWINIPGDVSYHLILSSRHLVKTLQVKEYSQGLKSLVLPTSPLPHGGNLICLSRGPGPLLASLTVSDEISKHLLFSPYSLLA